MRQPKHRRHFIGAMLMALLFILLISSLLYGWYIHTQDDSLPLFITRILLPLFIGAAISSPFVTYLYGKTNFHLLILPMERQAAHRFVIIVILICSSVGLFQPLSSSVRYNVGKVLHLQSIEEMPPHEQPTFLSLGEWHVDRLRVVPIHTYENGKLWNRNKVYLKSLFLLPIFSQKTAYRSSAKAWLAFKYENTISKKDFARDKGQSYFEQSLGHFKKINVGGFLSFELYDPGEEKQVLTQLARNHSYFESSYSAIYQGNSVDRDWISFRFFVYTVLSFIFIILPIYWLTARYLVRVPDDDLPVRESNGRI
ncbi:hypothetical protein M8998_09790 [Sphingobacterium sp. lm-10]|uniref:hypothetical protein n=1 Tax=Sphingobacterium sp. lm-10 TaxID=2944904 RepID=UPI002020AF38|nr:hypothetical protein [Sphingobacterium sp. lm-10]MCL7988228.1 hypothetical protein [Sphingobacterium sp. lm-10]